MRNFWRPWPPEVSFFCLKKIEMRQKTKNYCRRRWGPHNLSEEKQMDKKIAYEKYLSSACKNRTDIVKYKGKEFGASKAAEFSAEMRH